MFGVRDKRDGPQTEDFSHRIYRGDLFGDQIELNIPEDNTKVRFTCVLPELGNFGFVNRFEQLSKNKKGKMLNLLYVMALFFRTDLKKIQL